MALISNPDNAVSPPGILAIAIVFTFIVWLLAGVRFWALRHYTYKRFSPRWISNMAVLLIVVFVSVGLALLFYAYQVVYQMRGLEAAWYSLEDKRMDPSATESDLTLIDSKQEVIGNELMRLGLDTMKSSLAWRLSSTTALWLVKFSIVMVYVELWDNLTRRIRILMYITLWTIGLTYIVTITLFSIGMPSDNWGQTKTSDLPIVTEYMYGAANIVTDIQVLTIALWSLHIIKLPQSKLYAISLLLFMGCVTISLAIARAVLYDVHIRKEEELDQSVDIIGLVEPLVASWLACLPALRVLFRFRQRTRPEPLAERRHVSRGPGHARITSGNTDGVSDIDGYIYDRGDLEFGGMAHGTGIRGLGSNEYNTLNSHSTLSPIGVRLSSPLSDDEDSGKERGNSVRLSSFTGSDGSTQVGEWKTEICSDGETADKTGRQQRRMTAGSTTLLSVPPGHDNDKSEIQRTKAAPGTLHTLSPITTLSRNTTSASRKEGVYSTNGDSSQEECESGEQMDRGGASGGGGEAGSVGVVII